MEQLVDEDLVSFVGVQLVIESILKYSILRFYGNSHENDLIRQISL